MTLKKLLLRYTQFYLIYQEALKTNTSDRDGIADACKELMANDIAIDKEQTFYYLSLTQNNRTWNRDICFSYGEAMARKTYYTHKRNTTKMYLLELEAQREANIIEITLREILEDEDFLKTFFTRLAYLVPFDKTEITQMPEDFTVRTLWNFGHHLEAEFLFYDEKEFLHSTHEDADIPSSMSYGYSTVIDNEGKYGIIHNKTVLLSGEPDMEWGLPCEYYYIHIERGVTEVRKEQPQESDDYKDYVCDIVDIETKEVYASSVLCGSLRYDNDFIIVDEEGLLRLTKVDTEAKKIVSKSLAYAYIINRGSFEPSPVQDSKTKLWGYIDKTYTEIIPCKYKDWNSFNDGYAVLKEDDKFFVIDEIGDIIIEPKYRTIEHHEYDYFFVEDERGWWAVFLKDKIYIDFIDVPAMEEVPEFNNFPYVMTRDEKYYIVLRYTMQEKTKALQGKKYELPLKEYIKLFEPIRSERNLRDTGLLGKKVKVTTLPDTYKGILKNEDSYTIGWNYPSSASMFDMREELPVIFTKIDGSDLTLGISLENLELNRC